MLLANEAPTDNVEQIASCVLLCVRCSDLLTVYMYMCLLCFCLCMCLLFVVYVLWLMTRMCCLVAVYRYITCCCYCKKLWVFVTGGCSGRGVQWMGVVLYITRQPII